MMILGRRAAKMKHFSLKRNHTLPKWDTKCATRAFKIPIRTIIVFSHLFQNSPLILIFLFVCPSVALCGTFIYYSRAKWCEQQFLFITKDKQKRIENLFWPWAMACVRFRLLAAIKEGKVITLRRLENLFINLADTRRFDGLARGL